MQATEASPVSRFDLSPRGKKRLLALSGLVLVISVPLALLVVVRWQVVESSLTIGEAVPRLDLLSLTTPTSVVTLGAPSETKQVVLFFTVECRHCQRALLNFEALYRRYKHRGTFAAVTLSDPVKTQTHLHARGYSLPAFWDEKQIVRREYGIVSIPALFLIDERGRLRNRRFGEAPLDADEQLVLLFLNGTITTSTP